MYLGKAVPVVACMAVLFYGFGLFIMPRGLER